MYRLWPHLAVDIYVAKNIYIYMYMSHYESASIAQAGHVSMIQNTAYM